MQNELQPAFRALADPTRRAIIEMLAETPRTIREIDTEINLSRTAVVKHLKILEEGGVIRTQQKGRERINILRPDALKLVFDWLAYFDRYWDERLEKLKIAIEENNND